MGSPPSANWLLLLARGLVRAAPRRAMASTLPSPCMCPSSPKTLTIVIIAHPQPTWGFGPAEQRVARAHRNLAELRSSRLLSLLGDEELAPDATTSSLAPSVPRPSLGRERVCLEDEHVCPTDEPIPSASRHLLPAPSLSRSVGVQISLTITSPSSRRLRS